MIKDLYPFLALSSLPLFSPCSVFLILLAAASTFVAFFFHRILRSKLLTASVKRNDKKEIHCDRSSGSQRDSLSRVKQIAFRQIKVKRLSPRHHLVNFF